MIITSYNFPEPVCQRVPFQLVQDQYLLIMPINDVHWGADGCPKQRIADHIGWGLDRGAWFVGLGELMDFTSASQRKLLAQMRESQMKELDDALDYSMYELYEVLKPSKGRWFGMVEGDHWYPYADGTTVDQKLCGLLDCPFLGTQGYVTLTLGTGESRTAVVMIIHHGLGGGRRAGAGLLRVEDMAAYIPDASIYLMGHNHTKVNTPLDTLHVAPNGELYHRTRLLARTGGWQRGYLASPPKPLTQAAVESRGSYVERAALAPAALGGLVIGIGRKFDTHAKLWIPDIHHCA